MLAIFPHLPGYHSLGDDGSWYLVRDLSFNVGLKQDPPPRIERGPWLCNMKILINEALGKLNFFPNGKPTEDIASSKMMNGVVNIALGGYAAFSVQRPSPVIGDLKLLAFDESVELSLSYTTCSYHSLKQYLRRYLVAPRGHIPPPAIRRNTILGPMFTLGAK